MRSTLFTCLVASLSWVASAEPVSSTKNVCNSRPYSDYACLAHYAPAVNYCKQKYPSKVVCQTIKTVKTVTSTKPAQCGPTPAKYYARDANANANADAELESRDNGDAWKWNQLKKKRQNELQTFCRCIGYPRTRYIVETVFTSTATVYTSKKCTTPIPKTTTTSGRTISTTRATSTTSRLTSTTATARRTSTTTSSKSTTTSGRSTTSKTTTTSASTSASTRTTTASTTTAFSTTASATTSSPAQCTPTTSFPGPSGACTYKKICGSALNGSALGDGTTESTESACLAKCDAMNSASTSPCKGYEYKAATGACQLLGGIHGTYDYKGLSAATLITCTTSSTSVQSTTSQTTLTTVSSATTTSTQTTTTSLTTSTITQPAASTTCDVISDGGFEDVPEDKVGSFNTMAGNWKVSGAASFQSNQGADKTPYGSKFASVLGGGGGGSNSLSQVVSNVVPNTQYTLAYSYKGTFAAAYGTCNLIMQYAGVEIDRVSITVNPGTSAPDWATRTQAVSLAASSGNFVVSSSCSNGATLALDVDNFALVGQSSACGGTSTPTSTTTASTTTSSQRFCATLGGKCGIAGPGGDCCGDLRCDLPDGATDGKCRAPAPTCPSDQAMCGSICCVEGETCEQGSCYCSSGFFPNYQKDASNCGFCGNQCPSDKSKCSDGVCIAPTCDKNAVNSGPSGNCQFQQSCDIALSGRALNGVGPITLATESACLAECDAANNAQNAPCQAYSYVVSTGSCQLLATITGSRSSDGVNGGTPAARVVTSVPMAISAPKGPASLCQRPARLISNKCANGQTCSNSVCTTPAPKCVAGSELQGPVCGYARQCDQAFTGGELPGTTTQSKESDCLALCDALNTPGRPSCNDYNYVVATGSCQLFSSAQGVVSQKGTISGYVYTCGDE
ncbi:unnamed protein product [Zymoseptoria tritici ST99CH_1E4]|uniref:Apple domain-containing protein n=1 Tax=Zymoseptoria tritici ST99CH_1E4 TaxID=1276532 RepID=A0A2H1FJ88_ZYMTR|nr:unnamed protein product [Zymoseptoria tritici ST99CH_1E4]